MSIDAMSWSKALKVGGPAPKALILCIADYTDQWGWAYAPQETLAEEAEIGARTVRRYIADLARRGVLAVYQYRNAAGNACNLYRLVGFDPPQARRPMPEAHPSLRPGLKRIHDDGSEGDAEGDAEDMPEGDAAAEPADDAEAEPEGDAEIESEAGSEGVDRGAPPANLAGGSIGQIVQGHRPNRAKPPATAVAGEQYQQDSTCAGGRAREGRAPPRGAPSGGAETDRAVMAARPPPSTADPALIAAWQVAAGRLRRAVGDAAWRSWFEPLVLTGGAIGGSASGASGEAARHRFELWLPTRFAAERIRNHYGVELLAALRGSAATIRAGDAAGRVDWAISVNAA